MGLWIDSGSTVAERCGFMTLANEQLQGMQLLRLEFNSNVGDVVGLYSRQSILRLVISGVAGVLNASYDDFSLTWRLDDSGILVLEMVVHDNDSLALESLLGEDGVIGIINECIESLGRDDSVFGDIVRATITSLSDSSPIDLMTQELESNLRGATSHCLVDWNITLGEFVAYCRSVFASDNCIVTIYGNGDLPKPNLAKLNAVFKQSLAGGKVEAEKPDRFIFSPVQLKRSCDPVVIHSRTVIASLSVMLMQKVPLTIESMAQMMVLFHLGASKIILRLAGSSAGQPIISLALSAWYSCGMLVVNITTNPCDCSDHNKLVTLANSLVRELVNVRLTTSEVRLAVSEILRSSCGSENRDIDAVSSVNCYFCAQENFMCFDTWNDRYFDILDIGSLAKALTAVTPRDVERLLMGFKYDPGAEEVNASAAVGIICPLPNGVNDVSDVAKLYRDNFQVPTKKEY